MWPYKVNGDLDLRPLIEKLSGRQGDAGQELVNWQLGEA